MTVELTDRWGWDVVADPQSFRSRGVEFRAVASAAITTTAVGPQTLQKGLSAHYAAVRIMLFQGFELIAPLNLAPDITHGRMLTSYRFLCILFEGSVCGGPWPAFIDFRLPPLDCGGASGHYHRATPEACSTTRSSGGRRGHRTSTLHPFPFRSPSVGDDTAIQLSPPPPERPDKQLTASGLGICEVRNQTVCVLRRGKTPYVLGARCP